MNAQEALPIRRCLIELGHPQPPTPLKTDNSTAQGFINGTIKQKRSKSFDMRFYWLIDQCKQGTFEVYWDAGKNNLADYMTKHHPASHHQQVRPIYLYNKEKSPKTVQGCVEILNTTPPKKATPTNNRSRVGNNNQSRTEVKTQTQLGLTARPRCEGSERVSHTQTDDAPGTDNWKRKTVRFNLPLSGKTITNTAQVTKTKIYTSNKNKGKSRTMAVVLARLLWDQNYGTNSNKSDMYLSTKRKPTRSYGVQRAAVRTGRNRIQSIGSYY